MYTTPPQPETATYPTPPYLGSITFVLAGRTTLSEHCPTEHIDVDYKIAERSPYLQIYLPQHIRDDRPLLPIQLGDIDPAGFKLYIEWLTTNTIALSTRRSLRLDSCIDLIYAHIVGSAFSQPHFQDYIIDTLAHVLDPAQSFDQKILEMLFLEKHAGTVLRQFVTDRMFAYERRMLGMIRNAVEDVVTGRGEVKGCEYHVQEEGVCYKHGRVGGSEEREREGDVQGKKWCIDDDPELNAMAAQYLGKTEVVSATEGRLSTSSRKTRERPQPSFVSQRNIPPPGVLHITSPQPQNSAHKPQEMQSPNPSIRTLAPSIDTDKPLPPTPAPVHPPSTQDLVLECLGRLSPAASPALECTSTQHLIDQHLARSTTPTDLSDPSPSEEKEKEEVEIPPSLPASFPPHTHPPSVPHFAPLVKRKPAPPRGVDWLEQRDRLFALQERQGFGLRRGEKRERRSWFSEILGGVREGERMR